MLRELPLNSFQKAESSDSENDSVPDSWEDRLSDNQLSEIEEFNHGKLDTERDNVVPTFTRRTRQEMQKAKEVSEIGLHRSNATHSEKTDCGIDGMPEQKFPTSRYECLHTFKDHILFLTDMLPNLTFNGYNREKLIRDQYECPELGPAMKFLYGENADDQELHVDKATEFYILACDLTNGVLTFTHEGYQKLVLPKKYRDQLLYEVHDSPFGGGHLGLDKTRSKLKKFYWHHMPTDLVNYIRECPECQFNSPKSYKVPLKPRRTTRAFECVAIDLCGPMKENPRGYHYVANFIDCFTKYIVSVTTRLTTAKELAEL